MNAGVQSASHIQYRPDMLFSSMKNHSVFISCLRIIFIPEECVLVKHCKLLNSVTDVVH